MTVLQDTPIDRDSLRLRNEFLEMPGLAVTVPQAARLFGVRLDHAAHMLDHLEREGFLTHDRDGAFRRSRA
jgi:Mn-dependent DtxR family transcriptional regulator